VLCIIGNHDHREHARRHLGALMPIAPDAPPPLACVRAEVGGLQFIGLDTVLPGHPHGALDAPQLDWLARQLRACAGQPVALFMHHPPLTSGIDAMDRYGLLRGRAELARLVAGHGGVQFIACGHVHRPIAGVLELVQLSIIGIVFLQLADAIRTGRLTRADSLLTLVQKRSPRLFHLMESLFFALGALYMALGLWGSVPLLRESYERQTFLGNEGVFTVIVWPVKAIIVLGLAVCLLQFLRQAVRAAACAMAPTSSGQATSS